MHVCVSGMVILVSNLFCVDVYSCVTTPAMYTLWLELLSYGVSHVACTI